jgi:hypothetical protein
MDDTDKTIMEQLGDAIKSVVDTVTPAAEAEVGPKPEDVAGTAYANYTAPPAKKAGPRRQAANKRVAKAAKSTTAKAPAKKTTAKKAASKQSSKKAASNSVKKAAKKSSKKSAKKASKKKSKR